jgi:transcriptional regulator with XRE-family HTH domain
VAPRSPALLALGNAVRDFRGRLGLSQEELAHRAELNRTYLGDVERGTRNVSFNALRRIADALEIRASELLARGEELESPTTS